MPKEGVELMPEPEDRAILTAVDRGAEGYSGEDYGLSDKEARDLRRPLHGVSSFVWPYGCLLYTSPSPRDQRGSRMPSSA